MHRQHCHCIDKFHNICRNCIRYYNIRIFLLKLLLLFPLSLSSPIRFGHALALVSILRSILCCYLLSRIFSTVLAAQRTHVTLRWQSMWSHSIKESFQTFHYTLLTHTGEIMKCHVRSQLKCSLCYSPILSFVYVHKHRRTAVKQRNRMAV